MAATGVKYPSTITQESGGTWNWVNKDNVKTANATDATWTAGGGLNTQAIYTVKLYSSGYIGEDQRTGEFTSTSYQTKTFGGTENTWGATLSSAIVNDTGFGVGFGLYDRLDTQWKSPVLRCTNFGFSVPSGATINGITVVIYGKYVNEEWSQRSAAIDYVSMDIVYTEASGPALLKTVNGLAKASVKTLRSGLAIASGKTFNGLA